MKKYFILLMLGTILVACNSGESTNNEESKGSLNNSTEVVSNELPPSEPALIKPSAMQVLAKRIAQKIPDDARVAINLKKGDESTLPDDFLEKITTQFTEAMMTEGKDRFQMLNRGSTERIWEEVVEFNDVDVSNITSSASATVSVTILPKANEKGVDLSVSAYSLEQNSLGNVIASANELIPMDIKAELGVDIKSLDKKLEEISQLVDKSQVVKGNELSTIFIAFAQGVSLNKFARIYQEGCDKPQKFEDETSNYYNGTGGFWLSCEIYEQGELIIQENIDFNTKMDIGIITAPPRGYVSNVVINSTLSSNLQMPAALKKSTELTHCDSDGRASEGFRTYAVSVDNVKFYALHFWSGGGAGTSYSIHLYRSMVDLYKGPILKEKYNTLVKVGEHFQDYDGSPKERICGS